MSRTSHRNWIKKLIQHQGIDHLESPLDEVPLHRRWDRDFEVDVGSMSTLNPLRGVPDIRGLNLYTDGSKNSNNTGAGVVITDGGRVTSDAQGNLCRYNYHLNKNTTVFQSEVFALKMAATLILNGSYGTDRWVTPHDDITINSDSQASILALRNVWVKSKLVKETLDLMDRAASCCQSLTIRWVKSHVGHSGNVAADEEARLGRDSNAPPDWETPLLSKAVMHSEIDKMATRLWKKVWHEGLDCRQTRHFYPNGPRPDFFKSIITLPRIIVGQLVQILTGHTHLKRHQAVIDGTERLRILEALDWDNGDDDGNAIIDAPDPKCSRCGEGDETPLHLLAECDKLATLRLQIFGREDLVPKGTIPDFSHIPVYSLISFFREAKFETLIMKPHRYQYLPTNTTNEDSNKGLRELKQKGDEMGEKWTSKYLFRIPLKRVYGKRSKKSTDPNNINGVEQDGDGVEDIIGNLDATDNNNDTVDRLIESQNNLK